MPTKAQLLALLEDYPDDTEIVLWQWNRDGMYEYSTIEVLNPTCAQNPTRRTFELMRSGVYFDPSAVNTQLITGMPTKTGRFIQQAEWNPREEGAV